MATQRPRSWARAFVERGPPSCRHEGKEARPQARQKESDHQKIGQCMPNLFEFCSRGPDARSTWSLYKTSTAPTATASRYPCPIIHPPMDTVFLDLLQLISCFAMKQVHCLLLCFSTSVIQRRVRRPIARAFLPSRMLYWCARGRWPRRGARLLLLLLFRHARP